MLSPAKLIGITATIAVAGAFALALPANDVEQSETTAAPTEPTEIADVEGTLQILAEDDPGVMEHHDWGTVNTDELWTGRYDLDDDRLDGYGRARFNSHNIGMVAGPKSGSYYIENEGGNWVGTGHAWSGVGNGGWHHRMVLEGQGGYDGLTAILSADQDYVTPLLEVSGVVFDGGLPPMPGPAPTEVEQASQGN